MYRRRPYEDEEDEVARERDFDRKRDFGCERELEHDSEREYEPESSSRTGSYPPIGLLKDFNVQSLAYVKLQSDKHGSRQAWIADISSKESYAFALLGYERHAAALHYTPKLKLTNFVEILDPDLQTQYTAALEHFKIDLDAEETDKNKITDTMYKDVVKYVTAGVFKPGDRSRMVQFLTADHQGRRKPDSMSTHAYFLRLEVLCRYTRLMPGTTSLPTSEQRHLAYFYGQPEEWQHAFDKMYDTPSALSTDDLIAFMQRQEQSAKIPHGSPRQSFNRRRRRSDSNTRRFDSNTPYKRSLHRSLCPVHNTYGHTWSSCFCNPDGVNYDGEACQRRHSRWIRANPNATVSRTGSPPPFKRTGFTTPYKPRGMPLQTTGTNPSMTNSHYPIANMCFDPAHVEVSNAGDHQTNTTPSRQTGTPTFSNLAHSNFNWP